MSDHTPGPWHVGKKRKYGIYAEESIRPDGWAIAEVRHWDPGLQAMTPEDAANARLIAAAADLLAALEPFLTLDTADEVTLGDIRTARAAVAKAKGETP